MSGPGRAGSAAGWLLFLLAALPVFLPASAALAHGSGRGLVLLLPTGYYRFGGALAVALSFLLLVLVPGDRTAWFRTAGIPLCPALPRRARPVISLGAFLVLVLLVLTGLAGPESPLDNLLPLTVWTFWWTGLTLFQLLAGNLWPWLNPWSGPLALLRRFSGRPWGRTPLWRLPARLGHAPAIAIFFAFAWYELVSPAPGDPGRLARAVTGYWLLTMFFMILAGEGEWRRRGEPFGIFFRLAGGLAPLRQTGRTIRLVWPGSRTGPPLPVSGVALVLLFLSSVSFDGLSGTFAWLGLTGINPLAFPGRSGVIRINTAGLVATFAALSCLFVLAVRTGCALAGNRVPWQRAAGLLVHAIVPIVLAFHAAHYMTAFMVDIQYGILAIAALLMPGSPAPFHVTTSFLNSIHDMTVIWTAQTILVVLGHAVAVIMGHGFALRLFGSTGAAMRSQLPLTVLMVLYTFSGLWLLSAPAIGR